VPPPLRLRISVLRSPNLRFNSPYPPCSKKAELLSDRVAAQLAQLSAKHSYSQQPIPTGPKRSYNTSTSYQQSKQSRGFGGAAEGWVPASVCCCCGGRHPDPQKCEATKTWDRKHDCASPPPMHPIKRTMGILVAAIVMSVGSPSLIHLYGRDSWAFEWTPHQFTVAETPQSVTQGDWYHKKGY
jgi:hypothetical protein